LVRILSTTIGVPLDAAYEFAQKPENFTKWAAGLAKSLRHTSRGWVADTSEGEATVRFSEQNAYCVLDHWVAIKGRPETYIPLRMIKNGDGTEVELVLFRQAHMTDEIFDQDTALVVLDLASLKALLETAPL
jgi:hypothetical protein